MTELELDGMLRRVLFDALRNEEADREEGECIFAPSKNYLRQMKLMQKNPIKWLRNRSKPVWKVIVQKVAIILLIASLGLGSVMAVSPTARAAVIRWVIELYETHIVYRFYGEPTAAKMPNYVIENLPEKYVETDRIETDASVSLFYEDFNGGFICFDYIHVQQGAGAIMTTQENVEDVTVNGLQGQLFVPTDTRSVTTVVWIDPQVNMQFMIESALEPISVMELAESVCVAKEK